jgi:hypothetical protein
MAYNPVNTLGGRGDGTAGVGSNSFPLAAPESLRDELWRNVGLSSFYGLNILEFNEMGVGQKFNTLFNTAAGGATYRAPNSDNNFAFAGANDEIVVGVDRTRDSLIRAVATDAESGSEFTLIADDQYSIRQNKIGYFGSVEEGRVVLDNRVLVGVAVGA